MKSLLIALAIPLALLATPVAAQSDEQAADDAEAMAKLSEIFAVEPLTAEQKARLPLATDLVTSILPDGAMADMMNSMFSGFLDPLLELGAEAGPDLGDHIGYAASELELSDEQVVEIATLIDPEWKERQQREMALIKTAMGEVMTAMEPAMRKGLSEAYAVHFSDSELRDIGAFFATEGGATFARKSYALSSDPRIMGAAMTQIPTIMQQFEAMGAKMEAAMADLPQKQTFDTLAPTQKARITELTGLSEEELRIGMEAAAAAEEESGPLG